MSDQRRIAETSIGLRRTECWRCGYYRLIYESCPKCGGSCKPRTKRTQQRGERP